MPNAPQTIRQPRPQAHKLEWSRTPNAGRQWYSSQAWQDMRQRHLMQHPYCVQCVAQGKPMLQAMPKHPHVDHVIPHRGEWSRFIDPSNLQTLCHKHHSEKTKREQANTE